MEVLKRIMESYALEDVAVAFSGGVDSSLLLKMACDAAEKAGRKVYGIFLHTMLHPLGDAENAGRAAQEAGAELIADTCIDEACCWGHLAGKPGVTDSPKAAYYTETAGIRMAVRDTDTCIRWAQKGRVC